MSCSFYDVCFECGSVPENLHLPQNVIPHKCCTRDISWYLNDIRVSDIETEFELILARAGIFSSDEDLLST